jgi:excisionase family DNA binding protein
MMADLARALLDELRGDPRALAELRDLLAAGPAVYSCATLAAELGCTPRAVRAAIERGDLAAVRSGRGWVIASEAVAAWATPVADRARCGRRSPISRTMRDALARLDDG